MAEPDPKRPAVKTGGGATAGDLAGVGLQFAATILCFLLLGMWLDRRLGTDPWLMLAGVMLGGVGGFWSMYRRLVIEPRRRERGES
ncbi:MAG TPA: AtpZ/AtpI family protein [Longimicrobium sp.]